MYLKLACLPVILLVIFLCIFNFKNQAIAAVSACTVTADVTSFNASTTSDITFTITNSDSTNNIARVFITRDSDNYTINTGGATSSYTDSSLAIGPGQSEQIPLSIDVGATNEGATAWSVVVSDIAGGGDNTTCSGDIQTSIVNGSEAFAISGVTVSDIAKTSVKISWTTNVSGTTLIEYGTTSSYGSSSSDGTLTTSHSVTIGSLSEGVNYHYKLTSVDGDGNTVTTGDNTFTTASSQTTTTTKTITITPTPTPTPAPDITAPTVTINTDFKKNFVTPPKILGKATDNKGIIKIEYSLDDGRNWQAVDNIASLGKTSTSWDFTPPDLDDDNYKIRVRAIDSAGNIGRSKTYTMVIDRLPPTVGAIFSSFGPQALIPNSNGVIVGVSGLNQKIALSTVGGPTSIDLISGNKIFSLVKNRESGLWGGILNFGNPGIYSLEANSVDGAGNKTVKKLNSILILPQGTITDGKNNIEDAKVSLYYQDFTTKRFVLWDGKSYGQTNPQKTGKDGMYKLFVPPGKYYLSIKAKGYRNFVTNIFEIDKSMPLNNVFTLEKTRGFKIGPITIPFFDFSQTYGKVKITYPKIPDEAKQKIDLVGKEFPTLDLRDGDRIISTSSFRGKPTFITALSTWNPFSSQQISILNSLKNDTDVNFVAIFPQETASKISMFKKRGGYNFSMLADPDGLFINSLNIQSLPLHIYIDRKGVVRSVTSGIMTVDEIEKNLIN